MMYIDSRSVFFFFKQKTAYEMRISDWSSDVCSSDLSGPYTGTAQHLPSGTPLPGGCLQQQRLVFGDSMERFQIFSIRRRSGSFLKWGLRLLLIIAVVSALALLGLLVWGSEERRVGTECVRTFRSRWSP